ncbi:MAG: hypothetical protein ABSF64_09970 [Bryobacteraceae bacterium]|jgi:hypothetical protein
MTQKRDAAPSIFAAGFTLLILAFNAQLLTRPIVEFTDFAANSLLVQQARHFTLLTGHYSRFQFHHPGPAFLYLFALGEFVFHDVLHAVPAPYNGQLLIAIIFNGMLLWAALYVFQRHAKLSIPLAMLATMIVLVMANASGQAQPPVLLSNWMPNVLLFPFLLFAISAASVLAGETRDLPFLAFAGMLLIHAHFAQFLFVGIIGGGTVFTILARARRRGRWRAFLAERRRDFVWAAAIVFVFALPPLLELVLDRPNNLDALLTYQRQFGDLRNSLRAAIGYFACFLLFVGQPELVLTKGPAGLLAAAFSRPAAVVYWMALTVLLVIAVARRRQAATERRRTSLFLWHLIRVGAGSVVLFLYWATRIAGGLQAFNGNFIYSMHLLAWFLLLAWVEPVIDKRAVRIVNILAFIMLLAVGIVGRTALRSPFEDHSNILQAATAAPAAPFGSLAIAFDHVNWPWAVAVANSMQRLGKPFCVNPDWGFMFSSKNVCPETAMADKLWVATGAAVCVAPCRYLYRDSEFSLSRHPAQRLTLPLEIVPRASLDIDRSGFNEGDGAQVWLRKHADIGFRLLPDLPPTPCFRIALTGFAPEGRPAQLRVNGLLLGTLSRSRLATSLFVVPREAIRAGEVNHISLDTENAGPVGADPREIGFGFVRLVLRGATPEESCGG